MSNAWINVRLGLWHIILGEKWLFSIRVSRNDFHKNNPKRFELHQLKLFGVIFK